MLKLAKGSYYDRAAVFPTTWNDLLVPDEPKGKEIWRGILKNCKGAKRIVPVWTGMGWADCSTKWLMERGVATKFLKGSRNNNRIWKERS